MQERGQKLRKRYIDVDNEWESFLPSDAQEELMYVYSANADKCYKSAQAFL